MSDAPLPGADALIGRLTSELRPVAGAVVLRRLLIGLTAGAAVSVLIAVLVMGPRPDMAQAIQGPMFWMKSAYVLVLAGVSIWACERLARPSGLASGRLAWAPAAILAFAAIAAWRFAEASEAERMPLLMGDSAQVCSLRILALSLPPLAGLVWAVRGLAPTRLRLTGLMTGLAAGGVGAAAYALHCPEHAMPFLAIWYTAGVLMTGALGALLGPRLLRW